MAIGKAHRSIYTIRGESDQTRSECETGFLTELQIHAVVRYHFLIILAGIISGKFDPGSYQEVPYVPTDTDAFNISSLREHLQRHGRLREARAVLDIEVALLDGNRAKQEACRSLLEACNAPAMQEPSWFITCRARLLLAQLLRTDDQLEEANQQFDLARSLSCHAPVPTAENNMELEIRYGELKSTTFSDPQQNLQSWITFYNQSSVKMDDYMMCEALGKAAQAALEILQRNPNEESKSNFWQWQLKAEDLLDQVGDLYTRYSSRVGTGWIALNLFDQHGAILQWHDEFDAANPHFNLWSLKTRGTKNKLLSYAHLDDQDDALRTISEINAIEEEQERFWSDKEYIHRNSAVQRTADEKKQKISKAIYPSDMIRSAWMREWAEELPLNYKESRQSKVKLGTSSNKKSVLNEELLLEWMRSSAKSGELAESELRQILCPPDRTGHTADVYDLIDQLSPETLSELLYGSRDSPTTYSYWETAFSAIADWLLNRTNYHEVKRSHVTLSLQAKRWQMKTGPFSKNDIKTVQTLLDMVPKMPREAQALALRNVPVWRNDLCLIKRMLYLQETGHEFQTEEDPQFLEILKLYETTLREVQESRPPYMEAVTRVFIGQLCYCPAMNFRPAAAQKFEEALKGAEIAFQKNRESWKFLKGWDKVEKLLMSLEETFRYDIAPLMISLLQQFRGGDDLSSAVALYIWTCIQTGKSFGLGWLMQTNVRSITGTPQLGPVGNIDAKFEATPVITRDELGVIAQDAGSDVVFVDWFKCRGNDEMLREPLLATLAPGEPVKISQVQMTWKEVDALLERILQFNTDDLLKEETLQILRKLNPLIEPLATLSRPGQVLVFSAAGELHRIPIHALQLGKELLIQRNPIVYCSNMTVLNMAFQERKSSERSARESERPFQAAVFADPPSDAGHTAVKKLAKTFSVEPHVRDSFTSSNFTRAIVDPNLDLFHYHGHVAFEENSLTDHCLIFDDRDVTLRDVFDLAPTPSSYHATLLGCGSGMSKTHVSSDVIGLVPAFLYSGAASTVSTLWSFADADAAMYAHYFYAEFRTLIREGRNARVDLARANQKAVLAIMEKRPEMYHWAPFVLNGYWMMEVRGKKSL